MNTKHTPGPWVISQSRKKVYIQGRNNSAYFSIADVGGPNNRTVDAINERIANIRLITVAPEMAECMREAEENSRKRLPVKKETWLKMCELLAKIDGK